MVRKQGERLKQSETKSNIIKYILDKQRPVSEPEIRKHLEEKHEIKDQGRINRHLHELKKSECIELFPPEKKGLSNHWGITKLKTLEKIIQEYPDLIEVLHNSELAYNIVLDALEDALVTSTNLKKTKEYKEKYNEIKKDLLRIRENLTTKLKMSNTFFKLCIQDEYALYRNIHSLLDISDYPAAASYIGDDFVLFINSPSCIDLAFKSCIALEIMERKGNVRKDMKKEIEYVKQMNNTVPETQIKELEKYYKNLINELVFIKQMEKTDPSKQLEYLKNNYEKILKAPIFIKDTKFVPVSNDKLYELQNKFEDKDGIWDYLNDKEHEGSA